MAGIPGSVPVTGFIAPTDSADTYATQDEAYNRGGWRTVATLTARNAITADRRKVGMIVRVLDAGGGVEKFYTLVGGIANINWQEQSFGGGGTGKPFYANQLPVETPDGSRTSFTLPGGDVFVAGSLFVCLNGQIYEPASIVANPGRTGFSILDGIIPTADDKFTCSYSKE